MSILRLLLATAALFLVPVFIGILFGFLQLGVYRLLVKAGRTRDEDVPMFPILFLRGMLGLLIIVAGHVFYYQAGGRRMWFAEVWSWATG